MVVQRGIRHYSIDCASGTRSDCRVETLFYPLRNWYSTANWCLIQYSIDLQPRHGPKDSRCLDTHTPSDRENGSHFRRCGPTPTNSTLYGTLTTATSISLFPSLDRWETYTNCHLINCHSAVMLPLCVHINTTSIRHMLSKPSFKYQPRLLGSTQCKYKYMVVDNSSHAKERHQLETSARYSCVNSHVKNAHCDPSLDLRVLPTQKSERRCCYCICKDVHRPIIA